MPGSHPHTLDDELAIVRDLGARLSNWGRWGPDDQLGTLNYITPAHVAAAAALVTRGAIFSLALPLDQNGPQTGPVRQNLVHVMTQTGTPSATSDMGGGSAFADDLVLMYLQGSTQWDALAHVFYDGKIYGGRTTAEIDGAGAHFADIAGAASRFVGRGVLLDIARLLNTEVLADGFCITADHLNAAAGRHAVEIRPGDVLLVRTGLMAGHRPGGSWDFIRRPQPGLHYSTLEWLHEKAVAAVATDTDRVEAEGQMNHLGSPFHMVALRDMGLYLGEFWNFENLADDCAHDGRYEFFLAAQGLPVTRAVGSPVNPVAVK